MSHLEDSSTAISPKTGLKKGIYILPSLFTTASLFCAFNSITHSIAGNYLDAAWLILLAGILDALDGRVARLAKAQTAFGLEYDSLVDLASFGLAPAVLVFTAFLKDFHRLGWGAAFLFFVCGALRLARFNVMSSKIEKRFFQGLPIPMAAYALTTFVIFQNHMQLDTRITSYLVLIQTIVLALLMVSTVHYRSFKQLDFSKPQSFLFLVAAAVVIFLITSAPQVTLFCMSFGYVLVGMVDELIHLRNRKTFWEQKAGASPTHVNPSTTEGPSKDHLKVVQFPPES